MSTVEQEARITELETRLAFQDDTIQALNDVIVEQQRRLDRLAHQLQVLAGRQDELLGRLELGGGDEAPPPHY